MNLGDDAGFHAYLARGQSLLASRGPLSPSEMSFVFVTIVNAVASDFVIDETVLRDAAELARAATDETFIELPD